LSDLCASLREDPNSFSEPDVIVDLGEEGLMFIEVKHCSGNDLKPADYCGWSRYESAARLGWRIENVLRGLLHSPQRTNRAMSLFVAHNHAALIIL
jgi:hypothetical protein